MQFLTCVCPTFKRPKLLSNSIACFLAQDYPADKRELIILDDAGQIEPQKGEGWEVVSINRRFSSLPAKFNALAGLANPKTDAFVVWEDDDIYLPHHLSAHAKNLFSGYSKPSRVFSTYPGYLIEEPGGGNGKFHASLAFSADLFRLIGGWPLVSSLDFDQQLMIRLASRAGGIVGDATRAVGATPSYVFRWASTGAYHGQAFGHREWYEAVGKLPLDSSPVGRIVPAFDGETLKILEQVSGAAVSA